MDMAGKDGIIKSSATIRRPSLLRFLCNLIIGTRLFLCLFLILQSKCTVDMPVSCKMPSVGFSEQYYHLLEINGLHKNVFVGVYLVIQLFPAYTT